MIPTNNGRQGTIGNRAIPKVYLEKRCPVVGFGGRKNSPRKEILFRERGRD